jgi:hypothetical protein
VSNSFSLDAAEPRPLGDRSRLGGMRLDPEYTARFLFFELRARQRCPHRRCWMTVRAPISTDFRILRHFDEAFHFQIRFKASESSALLRYWGSVLNFDNKNMG